MKFALNNLIKSLFLGIIICFAFTFSLGYILNTNEGFIMSIGIAIISTLIYCTNLIIDTINSKN